HVLDYVEQCCLEPREGEVEPGHARDGEVVRAGVSRSRDAVDLGAAGVTEPEQARSLVEGLSRGVVEPRTKHWGLARTILNVRCEHCGLSRLILSVPHHRLTAARNQAEKRRLDRVRLEIERRNVSLE